MSIKEHALIVSLTVNKPQLTKKDEKATRDAEDANNAHGAGQFRKDLYPKHLIAPIAQVESSARAYIERTTYPWARGEYLLPTQRFMEFAERVGKYELEFSQCVTAFLNNWSNVMYEAQLRQGELFDANAYPDLDALKKDFRFRVVYRPVTDTGDFRVAMQESELSLLRLQVEEATKESMNTLLRAPLERLREVVAKLQDVTSKEERAVLNKRTGREEIKPPIFRDSVVDNIIEEISLLRSFADAMPADVLELAEGLAAVTPPAEQLRNSRETREITNHNAAILLSAIDDMLEN